MAGETTEKTKQGSSYVGSAVNSGREKVQDMTGAPLGKGEEVAGGAKGKVKQSADYAGNVAMKGKDKAQEMAGSALDEAEEQLL